MSLTTDRGKGGRLVATITLKRGHLPFTSSAFWQVDEAVISERGRPSAKYRIGNNWWNLSVGEEVYLNNSAVHAYRDARGVHVQEFEL